MNNLFEENKDILELYSKYWGNFLYNFENLFRGSSKNNNASNEFLYQSK